MRKLKKAAASFCSFILAASLLLSNATPVFAESSAPPASQTVQSESVSTPESGTPDSGASSEPSDGTPPASSDSIPSGAGSSEPPPALSSCLRSETG